MRRRFFVDEVHSGQAEIAGDEAKHLTRVLRVEVGQRYEISDNRQVYLAEIVTARKEQVVFRTLEKLAAPEPMVHLTLCAALIKFDHFEWMIEKATELGVSRIVPVIAIRSEHGLEKAAAKRAERWRRIGLEASQQSRRAFLPEIEEPVRLKAALEIEAGVRVFLDEDPRGGALLQILPSTRSVEDRVALLVGPEGGWTDEERDAAIDAGWSRASLGPLILRAETAALAALGVLGNAWLASQTGTLSS